MVIFVSVVHVILCAIMIFVILLQPGKDAGMGAALGGGAATSAFGGRGAVTALSRMTAICAVLFFVTSLGLSFVGLKRSVTSSVVSKKAAAPLTVPETKTPPVDKAPVVPVSPSSTPAPAAPTTAAPLNGAKPVEGKATPPASTTAPEAPPSDAPTK